MKARWLGTLTVGASLLLAGGTARAYDDAGDTGGPSSREGKELAGQVVRSEAKKIYIEHRGAVVAVEIEPQTRFFGFRSTEDLAPGQEVRASLAAAGRDGKNVAHDISRAPSGRSASEPEPVFTDQG